MMKHILKILKKYFFKILKKYFFGYSDVYDMFKSATTQLCVIRFNMDCKAIVNDLYCFNISTSCIFLNSLRSSDAIYHR